MLKKSKSGAAKAKTTAGAPPRDEKAALVGAEQQLRYDDDAGDEAELSGSAEATARYIADMVGALAAMAGEARLDLLTYLLNMARVEAELQSRQSEDPDSGPDEDDAAAYSQAE